MTLKSTAAWGQRKQIIQFNAFLKIELYLKIVRLHRMELQSGSVECFSWWASAGTSSFCPLEGVVPSRSPALLSLRPDVCQFPIKCPCDAEICLHAYASNRCGHISLRPKWLQVLRKLAKITFFVRAKGIPRYVVYKLNLSAVHITCLSSRRLSSQPVGTFFSEQQKHTRLHTQRWRSFLDCST